MFGMSVVSHLIMSFIFSFTSSTNVDMDPVVSKEKQISILATGVSGNNLDSSLNIPSSGFLDASHMDVSINSAGMGSKSPRTGAATPPKIGRGAAFKTGIGAGTIAAFTIGKGAAGATNLGAAFLGAAIALGLLGKEQSRVF